MRVLLVAVAAAIAGGTSVDIDLVREAAQPAPAVLSAGDPALLFTLRGSDGRTYRLADYRGRQAVVLAWFAKAFTGG